MKKKKPQKAREVILTDMQVHAILPTNPKPLNRQAEKSIKSGKPGRAYTTDIQMGLDGKLRISFPTHDTDGAPIKYLMPKDGIKLYLAPDAIDKLKSLEKNRNAT